MHAKILAVLIVFAGLPAMAAPNAPGRYQILSVSGGFVRLDTVTGATTLCRDEVDSFRCTPIPIADETAPGKAEAGATPGDDRSAMDLDKALGFMERAMRGLMAMTEEKTPECAL